MSPISQIIMKMFALVERFSSEHNFLKYFGGAAISSILSPARLIEMKRENIKKTVIDEIYECLEFEVWYN